VGQVDKSNPLLVLSRGNILECLGLVNNHIGSYIQSSWWMKFLIQSGSTRTFLVQCIANGHSLQAHPWWMKVLIQSGPPRAFMVHCVPNGNFMPIQCPKSLFGSLCSRWPFLTLNSRFTWVDFQKAPINRIYICHIYPEPKKYYSKLGFHADSHYQYW
jgi:hypothetical protein